MSALTIGSEIEVPGFGDGWQVWSKADGPPGAYFVVKDGEHMRIKAIQKTGEAHPRISVI